MEPIIGVMVAMRGNALGGAGSGSLGKRTPAACGGAAGPIGTPALFEAVTRPAKQQRRVGGGPQAQVLDYSGKHPSVEEWPGVS